ncbi:hypothetical protein BDV96DRAFT_627584 [Lophiotrema nucula]|uniref:Uncharacterized protein n=1 Tax=Lophiotrema nucula TaxID=690887 RepID=A0A6A5ZNH0_9PLEO|nr:hypothetical protein BDV96DRAFT_627584 [Lophiotrema nucula]
MNTANAGSPIVPDRVRSYIYYEPGQQFPTSDFRMSAREKEPLGWDFEDIRMERELDENWWFVSLSNVELTPIGSEDDESQEPPTDIPKKLVIDIVGPIKFFGSGLIVDAKTFTIVGCYKNYADSWQSEAHKIEDLFEEQKEAIADKTIAIATKRYEGLVSGSSSKVDAMWIGKQKKALEKMQAKYHRERILLADERPHRIAVHKETLLAISERMNDCELKRYGKRYEKLFKKFRNAAGNDFKASEDVPAFVRNSFWYGESDDGERSRAGGSGRMAVEELGEDGNPGDDME